MPTQVAGGICGRDARVRLKEGLVRPRPSAGTSPSTHEPEPMMRFGRRPGPAPRMCQKPSTPHLVRQPQSAAASCGFHSFGRTAVIHLQPTRKALPHLKTHCKPNSLKKTDDYRAPCQHSPRSRQPRDHANSQPRRGLPEFAAQFCFLPPAGSGLTWYL